MNDEGKKFIVIKIEEFDEFPVICKKEGEENLQKGAIYVRTRRIPESAKVSNSIEMREIVEMAVDKGIKRFAERLFRVGLTTSATEEEQFNQQLGELR